MPKYRRTRKAANARQTGTGGASNSNTDYKIFLDSLVKKEPGKLSQAAINKWQDINPNSDSGKIINEIAKKFNTNKTLGINKVKYIKGAGQPNFYEGMTSSSHTQLTLAPPPYGTVAKGPLPQTVAHELVHANDHQIDSLNPLIWRNIATLANTGNGGSPISNFAQLDNSLRNIQAKIDPYNNFSAASNYVLDQQYIERELQGAKANNPSLAYTVNNAGAYSTPMTGNGANSRPDWNRLFNDIDTATTTLTASSTIPNSGFFLNHASEYPAFISENLTGNWKTNQNPGALSRPEAQFLGSTLNNMDAAYPAVTYPTINKYIRQRKNSLDNAYGNTAATNNLF